MLLLLILGYLLIIRTNSTLLQHENLIKDYFVAKHNSICTIFGCNKEDGLKLLKTFSAFRANFFIMKENVTEEILLKNHLVVVIDGTCEYLNNFLQECGRKKIFTSSHHVLIIKDSSDTTKKFVNVSTHINADINVASLNDDKSMYIIWDVYNPSYEHGGDLKINRIGFHSLADGFAAYIGGSKYWIRRNMTGVLFKSAVVIPKQHNVTVEEYLASDTNREVNSMHRFQSVTIKHCQDLYNFSLNIQKTESWGYIVPHTGGKFDGLVGLLQRREVDFGCSPLIFKYDRLPVVDYSFGNWILKSVFVYQPPKSTASSFEIFLRPLSTSVWICTIFASIFITIVMKLCVTAEVKMIRNLKHIIETRWSFVVLSVLGAFCQQDSSYFPILMSGRVMVLFLFILYVLLYQFYSGYIVSYLLMDPPRTINNLNDLLHSSLDAGIEDILIDRDYFVQTSDPVALELFHTKITKNNRSGFYEPTEGMDLVKKSGFAFHVETSTAYPIIKKTFPPRVICALEEVQMYRTQPMHTNAQKHSPFTEMLNYCMLRLVEHGLMYRLRNIWDTHRPECIEADHVIEITVGLEEFYSALVILLFGILVALIILIIEIKISGSN